MGLVPLPPSPSPLCLSFPLRVRKGHHESVLPSIRWGKREASVGDESYMHSSDQKVLLCEAGVSEKSWHGGHLSRCYEKPPAPVNT